MRFFYYIKPVIPRLLQIFLRRGLVSLRRRLCADIWPIDEHAGKSPKNWPGWPEQKQFALIFTHDVDTQRGHDKCIELIKIERAFGFRSSFNFVPERYLVSASVRQQLTNYGFEVGVHGLNHDGKLFQSRQIFEKRSLKINYYLREWNAVGFRAPAMHHNLDWIHDLKIEYDASTFDTDPFEPQPEAAGTVFPFWVQGNSNQGGYVELPYTLPQDFTLFILLREKNIDIWKNKLDWIAEKGGMALVNTHPDYMNFDGSKLVLEEYPVHYYEEFLQYIKTRHEGRYWHVLPKDIARFWKMNIRVKD